MTVERPDVREGYDLWAKTYDTTPNPLVSMDRRHTVGFFAPRSGEHLLDAACGTGSHTGEMLRRGSKPVGLDVSYGMLQTTRQKYPQVPLVRADLADRLPFQEQRFDGVLCALVGEHLEDLSLLFREFSGVLSPGGRIVFSVFHPELAAAGIESNFESDGKEYRLGAYRHTVADYLGAIEDSGFRDLECYEFRGDGHLVEEIPWAAKYAERPLLLIIRAQKAGWAT